MGNVKSKKSIQNVMQEVRKEQEAHKKKLQEEFEETLGRMENKHTEVIKKLEDERKSTQSWTMAYQTVSKRYNQLNQRVGSIMAKNKKLQDEITKLRSEQVPLLEQIRRALEADPMFEDEVRQLIKEDGHLEQDFKTTMETENCCDFDDIAYHKAAWGPEDSLRLYDNAPFRRRGRNDVQSDGVGRTESDSANKTESDSAGASGGKRDSAFSDDFEDDVIGEASGLTEVSEKDLESSAVIAFVLSKMHYDT